LQTWTEQRKTVYLDRYAKKDETGKNSETDIKETWSRVAKGIADDPIDEGLFYDLLADFKFVPGGRILAGAGTGHEVTYYNCYVIPISNETRPKNGNDSREAIFDTISRMVNIMSRGGGVGINWSTLRPNGAYLSRINGTTTGPLEWMDVASTAVGAVMQGGSRRGAAMFMLDDWHPDIEAFVNVKRDLKKITNANISVAVSDKFMQAVKDDADWILRFPDTKHDQYNTDWSGDINDWMDRGLPVVEYKKVKARDLWRKIAEGAWDNGEPGVIFLERYNKLSTAASVEKIICVNPCGEQGLGAYAVCNLGAMNLAAYVKRTGEFEMGNPNEIVSFDFTSFDNDVRTAIRFLDNVVDKNYYGDFTETEQIQKNLRRIGLSVMGLADALIMQGLRYGSPEAVKFTESVFFVMKNAAIRASAALALEKGPAPAWDKSMLSRPYLSQHIGLEARKAVEEKGLRNLFLLTQAPTGTTSILAGVNSGIEPYFAFEYERRDRTGTHKVVAPIFEDWYENNSGKVPEYFVTSQEVSVEEHVFMQAAVQKYIDSSVSKTLNAPNSHKVTDVEKAYTLAYECGLKSIAYFRDGSGRDQVLNTIKPEEKKVAPAGWKRSPTLVGVTSRLNTDIGTAFITVNHDSDGKPRELFVNVGKGGSDLQELSEAIGRLVSVGLQHDIPISVIGDQLWGVGGYSKIQKSLPTAIAMTLQEGLKPNVQSNPASNGNGAVQASVEYAKVLATGRTGQACPDCKSFSVVREEGCMKCQVCGYSAC
jgi:ribonucleoside-diphosphate reductase alpha chain